MNLIFRLIWMLICARFGARRDIMAESSLTYRCWPWDLDFNLHMTNSRYYSFMDLSRIDYSIRSGAWARLRAQGFYPVLGSSTVRFRRPVAPLQKFRVTTRILSWDERWIYFSHRIITGEDVAAVGIMKAIFVNKQGRIPIPKLMEIMGYTGPKPPFTADLQKKDELDALLKA